MPKASKLSLTFWVGLLVAVCITVFLVAFTFFKKGGYDADESYLVHAYFVDATGLNWKSRIQIAGIQVGEVESIRLVGDRARLEMRVKNTIILRTDTCLTKRLPSPLLPDALLDVALGTSETALRDLPEDKRQITCVIESSGMQKVFDSLSKVATDIQTITGDLSSNLGGAQGSLRQIIDNLAEVSETINDVLNKNERQVGVILENTAAFTSDLREITEGQGDRYRNIAVNVEVASKQLREVLDTVQGILGSNKGEMAQSVDGLRDALGKLNHSLEEIDKVATRIGEGKGVAGKLLADERLGNRVASTIDGVADYVDRVVGMKTELSLRTEWLLNQKGVKAYFGLRLIPKPDKFYLIELIADPRGVDTVVVDNTLQQNRDPNTGQVLSTTDTVTTQTRHESDLRFSLQIGKRWGPLTLRAGVIESSGGAGADLTLFSDALQLSVSVYQFSRPDSALYPRTKVFANYVFLQHLYATAGVDDFMNTWRAGRYPGGPRFSVGNDVFFGLGLFFTDDDLKAIMTTVGGAPRP
jgi:phospholipid/cholesterol/gamma-HCH transport system substrate-binding protein